MRKIKKMFWKISALAVLAAPVTAMAQWSRTSSGFQTPSVPGLSNQSISTIIYNVMMWLLGILGFIAIIAFVIAGIMYLVAAGDEDAQKRAKRAMYYAITGIIVGLVGLVIITAVQRMLMGTDSQF